MTTPRIDPNVNGMALIDAFMITVLLVGLWAVWTVTAAMTDAAIDAHVSAALDYDNDEEEELERPDWLN